MPHPTRRPTRPEAAAPLAAARRGLAAAVLLSAAAIWGGAAAFGLASAQEEAAAAAAARSVWDDPRPPVAAYVIVDAVAVEAPLGGASGDAARGRALFADPETGGCLACHAAPGLPRLAVAPRILRDRADPLPAARAAARIEAAPEPQDPLSDSDSRLAPEAARLAAARPTDLTPQEAGPPPDASETDVAGAPAEAEGEIGPPAPVFPGEDEPDRPRMLPLPAGPDLAGVASRLGEGTLRLWVIDPRAFGAGHVMPGYHAVSEALGARRPGHRQPWFSPAQVEDMVAYLATLTED